MRASILIASLLVAATPAMRAAAIEPSELPPRVRETLQRTASGAQVSSIATRREHGETVYQIAFADPGRRSMEIAADGQLLSKAAPPTPATAVPPIFPDYALPLNPSPDEVGLNDVPAPVRTAIERESSGRKVGTVSRTLLNGRPAFRVSFREAGRNPEVFFDAAGHKLSPEEKPPGLDTAFIGTRFEDTPASVQQTIRRVAGTGEIVRIDHNRWGGRPPTYVVQIRDRHGTYEVRISESGQVLESSRPAEPRRSDRG